MRRLAILLLGVLLCGCGAGDTYSPTFQGGGNNPSFNLTATPGSNSVNQGNSVSYSIIATSVNGFASPVALSLSGQPGGTTTTFAPTSVTPTANGTDSTLTITTTIPNGDLNGGIRAATGTPTGTYNLTVTGTGGGVTRTMTIQLVVHPYNFNPG